MTMDMLLFGKKILALLLVMIFFITGCLQSDIPRSSNIDGSSAVGNCPSGNTCAAGTTSGTTTGSVTALPPKVEIRHLIEPNLSTDLTYSTGTGQSGGGSYVRKLTLPKNFSGRIYLAGINFGTLSARIVKVRFKFGVSREPIVIPATVTQAPGITPQTPINVLVMDLRSQPFRNVRLAYDLFDYNEYELNSDDSLKSGQEPTQDNRNTGLYCRALRVEDDPTFDGVGACDGRSNDGSLIDEECLYTYAKVLDQGLVKVSGGIKVPLLPSFPQIKSITGSNYYMDYLNQMILKPLPDSLPTTSSSSHVIGSLKLSEAAVPASSTNSIAITLTAANAWDPLTILSSSYYFRGPYRLVNRPNWYMSFPFEELHGKHKLFRKNSYVSYPNYTTDPLPDDYAVPTSAAAASPEQSRLYYNSYLFPLATKLDLGANVVHLSSNDPDGVRSPNSLAVAGKTVWMDGSNARAQNRNQDQEHVGSCNVTASIEIIAKDDQNIDYVIAESKDVKLQLVRPTQYRTDTGNEVLFSNFKTCNQQTGCSGSECCFNSRCWDDTLVSQCMDSSSTQGNKIIGESCTTDLECTSLCCNRTSGQCAPHNSTLSPPVLCSKPIGDSCIAKEWCQKTVVVKCYTIKTGTDTLGNTTCRQQCYNVEEFGDCKNGTCIAPVQPPIPTFDPNAQGACDEAITAPSF